MSLTVSAKNSSLLICKKWWSSQHNLHSNKRKQFLVEPSTIKKQTSKFLIKSTKKEWLFSIEVIPNNSQIRNTARTHHTQPTHHTPHTTYTPHTTHTPDRLHCIWMWVGPGRTTSSQSGAHARICQSSSDGTPAVNRAIWAVTSAINYQTTRYYSYLLGK